MSTNAAAVTGDKLAELDALYAGRQVGWWNSLYADPSRSVSFFCSGPDESLHDWVRSGTMADGRALDIGCGNARNAIFLAQSGFTVRAVDYSHTAIAWAQQRLADTGAAVQLHHASVFDLDLAPGSLDLIYDSGCFHHIPPHRRAGYVELVATALKPGGWFGLACLRSQGDGGLSLAELYRLKLMGGGVGHTETQLREVWSGPLRIHELRQMKQLPATGGLFGESFLWTMLAQKPYAGRSGDGCRVAQR